VDAPDHRHVSDAFRVLQMLGAIDDFRKLTSLGRELARLPLDPRVARIALAGRGSACADAVFVLAAAMSVQDPHEFPADAQDAARNAQKSWRHPRSDFLTLLNLWQRWRGWSAEAGNRQLRKLCREHFVSFLRMEEWESVYKQIADLLGPTQEGRREMPKPLTPEQIESLYPQIHQCLLAGLIDHIGPAQRCFGDHDADRRVVDRRNSHARHGRPLATDQILTGNELWHSTLSEEKKRKDRLNPWILESLEMAWLLRVGRNRGDRAGGEAGLVVVPREGRPAGVHWSHRDTPVDRADD
jgi:HrpA-like RNA helicase